MDEVKINDVIYDVKDALDNLTHCLRNIADQIKINFPHEAVNSLRNVIERINSLFR